MPVNAVFKQPFDEQVAFFRGKLGNLIPTEKWTDVWKSAHDTGFMVAGAAKADLLADLAGAVDEAISQGTGLDAFRKNFSQIVEKHGWSYRGEFNWRTRTIYRTNMATSYSAGRLAQLKDSGLPYWMYRHSDSVARPRPLHVSWDGLALPANDPWWQSHYPPNGWGCQCYVIGVSEANARRRGRLEPAPDDGLEPDGRPKGIDKGWDYMPGETTAGQVIKRKLADLPVSIAKGLGKDIDSALEGWPPAFVEAKTVKEAERFGTRIMSAPGVKEYQVSPDGKPLIRYGHGRTKTSEVPTKIFGKVSYSGLELEMANHLNRMLIELQQECDRLGIPRLRGLKSGAGRAMASMGDGVMSVARSMSIKQRANEQFTPSKAKKKDPLHKKPFVSETYFTSEVDQVNSTLWHEFGHHIHQQIGVDDAVKYRLSPPLELELVKIVRENKGNLTVPTRYAATNSKEWFAESYALYKGGRSDLIDENIIELIGRIERGEFP